MNHPMKERMRDFERLALEKAKAHNLQIETVDERGVRATLDDLVFEFTQDHGDLVVSLASRHRPEACFAAEFVAVMLGDIEPAELASYRDSLDRFVASDADGNPPGLLRDTDWLLDWTCANSQRVIEQFCRNPDAPAQLDAIVGGYLG